MSVEDEVQACTEVDPHARVTLPASATRLGTEVGRNETLEVRTLSSEHKIEGQPFNQLTVEIIGPIVVTVGSYDLCWRPANICSASAPVSGFGATFATLHILGPVRPPNSAIVAECPCGHRNCAITLQGQGTKLQMNDLIASRVMLANSETACAPNIPAVTKSNNSTSKTWPLAYFIALPETVSQSGMKFAICWCALIQNGVSQSCEAATDFAAYVGTLHVVGPDTNQTFNCARGESCKISNVQGLKLGSFDRVSVKEGPCERTTNASQAFYDAQSISPLASTGDAYEWSGPLLAPAGAYWVCWCSNSLRDRYCDDSEAFRTSVGMLYVEEQECPGGQDRSGEHGLCAPCPAGTYSEPGAGRCSRCPPLMYPDTGQGGCRVDGDFVCVVLGCAAAAFLIVSSVAWHCRLRVRIADISQIGEEVVITTLGPHNIRILRTPSMILFEGTQHYLLDVGKYSHAVRVLDPMRLQLLRPDGTPISQAIDTSQGTFVQKFPLDLINAAVAGRVPLFLVAALFPLPWFIPTIFFSRPQPTLSVHACVIAAISLLAALAAMLRRRVYARAWSPLQRRLSQFTQRELLRAPVKTAPGAGRSVAMRKIVALLHGFEDYIRDRTAYYLNSNITTMLTAPCKLSYAEAVGDDMIMYFVSHYWGTAFHHFVKALSHHAKESAREIDWGSVAYWVCFLSNNQWSLGEELTKDWSQCSFFKGLRSESCLGTCMVLDTDALPLTRSWCLFELLQTFQLEDKEKKSSFQGLLFCTSSGVTNTGQASYDASVGLVRKLLTLSVEDATATVESDKMMIDGLVEAEGGFKTMNEYLRRRAQDSMGAVKEHFNKDFAMLEQQSRERSNVNGVPTDAPAI